MPSPQGFLLRPPQKWEIGIIIKLADDTVILREWATWSPQATTRIYTRVVVMSIRRLSKSPDDMRVYSQLN